MRKENNKEAIDPENFIMPDDRLLSAKEAKLLEAKGVVIKWVKCKFCGSLGATTDDRECCNLTCTIKAQPIDEYLGSLKRTDLRFNNFAQPGDYVMFKNRKMKVFSTDCTLNRLVKKRKVTFSYVLINGGKAIRVGDLEDPMNRIIESNTKDNEEDGEN
tara:strand:- start:803 stop:1279 length:477 start_codon:yes stop_codon:yes gene_type:complete